MSRHQSARTLAIRGLLSVIEEGRSLDTFLNSRQMEKLPATEKSLAKALIFGVLRNYFRLNGVVGCLVERPLKAKDNDVLMLLMMGLFQIQQHRSPDYAVVSETVNVVLELNKPWAKGFINGVLRKYIRRQTDLLQQLNDHEEAKYNAPAWLINNLKKDWPEHWQSICEANNQQAPMVLRVNTSSTSSDEYLNALNKSDIKAKAIEPVESAVMLENACDVEQLPGFEQGQVSVQDAAAQWAAKIINIKGGERVLDACAAPGGKTMHMLESAPNIGHLLAIDIDAERLKRIEQNLARLKLNMSKLHLKAADAGNLQQWWDQQTYDAILLDAPCSATGVIRRHPDIQLLRRESDIAGLQQQQQRLLSALWQILRPGGRLLYCTCSVLKTENEHQIASFLAEHSDAEHRMLQLPGATPCEAGVQFLAGRAMTDGFYYALLFKRSDD